MIRLGHGEEALAKALRELTLGWETASQSWRDAARREFEDAYVDQLTPAVKAAMSAMRSAAGLLGEAIRECS